MQAGLPYVLVYTALGLSMVVLTFGVVLLVVLRNRGGPDLALAHLVADPARRRLFLGGLVTSLVALFALGLAASVESLAGASVSTVYVTAAVLFVAGAAGLLVLMSDALRMRPLSLQEKWNLQEVAERASFVPAPVPEPPKWPSASEPDAPKRSRSN